MYKLSLIIEEYISRYKTEQIYYNLHAKKEVEDVLIASIPALPCNKMFLNWLKMILEIEEKKKPHLTADQVVKLIELFQDFLEEDVNDPVFPTIEKFSKIITSN